MYISPEKYLIKSERVGTKIIHTKQCAYCGGTFEAKRLHAMTCSVNCGQSHSRRIKKGLLPLSMPKSKEQKKTD